MDLNNLDLNKIRTFSVVQESGGVTAAAQRLHLTRSAVSQSLAALERTLGFALFDRIGKKLVLTPRGRVLFDAFQASQGSLTAALSELSTAQEESEALVRIGLFIGFSRARLTDFASVFLKENPSIQLKLLFVSQPDLVEHLTERKIDLALSLHPLSQDDSSIESQRLVDEELVLVSGRKFHTPKLTPQTLRQLPIIDYYQNGQLVRTWCRHHFGKDVGPLQIRAFGAAIDFVLELILKETGVGIVPRYVAQPYLDSKRLVQLRTGKPELTDAIWLNRLRGVEMSSSLQRFLKGLKNAL